MKKRFRKPRRIIKKKSIWQRSFFRLTVLCLTLLAEVFYLFVFSPVFQIKDIVIKAPKEMPAATFEMLIAKAINQKILFFPSRSIFLADFSELKARLKEFSYIKEVKLEKDWPDVLILEIQERTPAARWCGAKPGEDPILDDKQNQKAENQCHLIDKEGILFDGKWMSAATPDLVISPQDGYQKGPGEQAVEKEKITSILQIQKAFAEDIKIEIKRFVIAPNKLIAEIPGGWNVYFDINEDVAEQLFNLQVLLDKELPPENHQIEYIDLRFGNRVFYK